MAYQALQFPAFDEWIYPNIVTLLSPAPFLRIPLMPWTSDQDLSFRTDHGPDFQTTVGGPRDNHLDVGLGMPELLQGGVGPKAVETIDF